MQPDFDTLTVPYASTRDGRTLHAIVRRPLGDGPFPAILDFHGGAWTHFTPAVDTTMCEALTRAGYVTVSVDFRCAPRDPYPAFLDDARAALAFVRGEASTLRVDPRRIGSLGGSTGGHIAVLLGLVPSPRSSDVTPRTPPPREPPRLAFSVGLYPILDVPARYAMARDTRHGVLARAVAARLEARVAAGAAARGSNELGDPSPGLALVGALRRSRPWLGDRVGDALQAAMTTAGRLSVVRAFEYPHLVAAHDGAFPRPELQREASPRHVVDDGRFEALPPTLVVQGTTDPNLTEAMTLGYADAVRRRGGHVELDLAPHYAHGFGAIPSPLVDRVVARIDAFARRQGPTASAHAGAAWEVS